LGFKIEINQNDITKTEVKIDLKTIKKVDNTIVNQEEYKEFCLKGSESLLVRNELGEVSYEASDKVVMYQFMTQIGVQFNDTNTITKIREMDNKIILAAIPKAKEIKYLRRLVNTMSIDNIGMLLDDTLESVIHDNFNLQCQRIRQQSNLSGAYTTTYNELCDCYDALVMTRKINKIIKENPDIELKQIKEHESLKG
jgi:hypothetical protein